MSVFSISKGKTHVLSLLLFSASLAANAVHSIELKNFDKIIVSPHIELILEKGTSQKIEILHSELPPVMVNMKVVGRTLRVYMEDAKVYTKSWKSFQHGQKIRKPYYKGTQAIVKVTYKDLKKLSVRGEEKVECNDKIVADKFKLKLYGTTSIDIAALEAHKVKIKMYGENRVNIDAGSTDKQKLVSMGENQVKALKLSSKKSKATAFGEAKFNLQISEKLKLNGIGENEYFFLGNPKIQRRLMIGDNKVYEYLQVATSD